MSPKRKILNPIAVYFANIVWTFGSLMLFIIGTLGFIYLLLHSQLPDVKTLNDVQLQEPLRVYSSDDKLIAEFGKKRRIPISLAEVPKPLIQAILATEDQRFYEHSGVDIFGLIRAGIHFIRTGTKSQGASTITMQVARNFFLSRKKTYARKIKEILLALKIDKELSKEKILELYFNKIYFGQSAYGIAAAAEVYYGKPLDQLTLAEMAMLAGLPKAPSTINPIYNPASALKRRNYVLTRMLEEGFIDKSDFQKAYNEPNTASYHGKKIELEAPYVAEMVRSSLFDQFGEAAYTQGYRVHTTISSQYQKIANQALKRALIAYDKRHGYRGPVAFSNVGEPVDWNRFPKINHLEAAQVISLTNSVTQIEFPNGIKSTIPWSHMSWASSKKQNNKIDDQLQTPADIVKPGDIIYVSKTTDGSWQLSQLPEIEGALVSLNPINGQIEALVGGFSFYKSKYNRAFQAERQPGSSFKSHIYAAALAKGLTLASTINDAPIVRSDPTQNNYLWRPQNDSRQFYGPTRLRVGLVQSRNLVTIRLLENIGIDYAISFISKFGFNKKTLPHSLTLALGSATVTPLELAGAYAPFANGGYRIEPYFILRIVDSKGNTIQEALPKLACPTCIKLNSSNQKSSQQAERILSPQVAYLMNQVLQDVIQSGTGRAAKKLGRQDLGGKTGTTNDKKDAWFAGFNNHLVTVSWMGFDQPTSVLEYGSTAALPMWMDFMSQALKGVPEAFLPEPPGITRIRIDPYTGLLANSQQPGSFFEIFQEEHVPTQKSPFQIGETSNPTDPPEYLF